MEITLDVEVRAEKGTKKVLSSLREASRIPAIVYGGEKPPVSIALSEKDLIDARKKGGANAILHLKHGKGQETVMVKELQRHPVTDRPVHADFQRISLTKKVDARVPLVIVGEAPGVKDFGGMLAYDLRELRIKALPTAIPQKIEVDRAGSILLFDWNGQPVPSSKFVAFIYKTLGDVATYESGRAGEENLHVEFPFFLS
jgi:large subunit ribosomal protein L25